MPNPLTPEEKKARRAEINRQNAQKSTGPKSAAGTANSRLNGLKNGTRAVTIDLGAGAGLSLVTGEDPAAYRDMTAEYQRVLGPANRVESNLVQRIVDAQWRLLRNAKLQTLEFEAGLEEARQIEHPGVPATGVHLVDTLNANRVAHDAKYLRRLEFEENRLLRIIKMTYAELKELRKLDPLPLPPIRRRIECIGKPAAILTETRATMAAAEEAATPAETPQLADNKEQTTPTANDRSQPPAALPSYPKPFGLSLDEPAQPKTFAAGAGSLPYDGLDPI
ncbi:MAG: hypothetical protein ACK5UT_25080 [Acidobacteriota bacterium]